MMRLLQWQEGHRSARSASACGRTGTGALNARCGAGSQGGRAEGANLSFSGPSREGTPPPWGGHPLPPPQT